MVPFYVILKLVDSFSVDYNKKFQFQVSFIQELNINKYLFKVHYNTIEHALSILIHLQKLMEIRVETFFHTSIGNMMVFTCTQIRKHLKLS